MRNAACAWCSTKTVSRRPDQRHPLHNPGSTTIRTADLLRFVRDLGYDPMIVQVPERPSGERASAEQK